MEVDIRTYAYDNEGTLSSASGIDSFIILRMLLDSVFNIFQIFIRLLEIRTYVHRDFSPVRLSTLGMTYTGS
jgi:hypothetical protein